MIENYRRLNETFTLSELQSLINEWIDCNGPLPHPVTLITEVHKIRILAAEAQIHHVETQNRKVMLKRNDDYIMISGKFPRLTSDEPFLMLKEIQKWIQSFIVK
jgi:transcription-repair coupling factor (superfamily II helicase)